MSEDMAMNNFGDILPPKPKRTRKAKSSKITKEAQDLFGFEPPVELGIDLKTDYSKIDITELQRRLFNQVIGQALRLDPQPSILTLAAKLVKLGESKDTTLEMTTEELIEAMKRATGSP